MKRLSAISYILIGILTAWACTSMIGDIIPSASAKGRVMMIDQVTDHFRVVSRAGDPTDSSSVVDPKHHDKNLIVIENQNIDDAGHVTVTRSTTIQLWFIRDVLIELGWTPPVEKGAR